MKKVIKIGKDIGVAEQIQGKEVDAVPHPYTKGMWLFWLDGYRYIASNYAFKE